MSFKSFYAYMSTLGLCIEKHNQTIK